MNNNSIIKSLMYVQTVDNLPHNDIDSLIKVIKRDLKPVRYALAKHDKDVDDNGNPVKDHIHLALELNDRCRLNSVAKILNDEPEYIFPCNSFDNILPYLIHSTDNTSHKYYYSPYGVIANFNYPNALSKGINKKKRNRTNLRNR